MKAFRAALTSAILAATALVASAQSSEPLRLATDCAYFPFGFKTPDGTLKGYELDVGNEVAKRLNLKVEWVCQKFDAMIPALLADKVDLIIASVGITEERKQRIDFSLPYRVTVAQFIGPKAKPLPLFNADGTPNTAAFQGLRVGLQRGTTYDNWIQAKTPNAAVVRYDSVEQLYLDMKSGRVDVIFTNPMKAHIEFLSKADGAGYEVIGSQLSDSKYFGDGAGIAMRKGNDALRERINGALRDMNKDGSMERFSKTYFPFAIYPKLPG